MKLFFPLNKYPRMNISRMLDYSEMLPPKRECITIPKNIPREELNELLKEASGGTFNGFVDVDDGEEEAQPQMEIKSIQDIRREIQRLQQEIRK